MPATPASNTTNSDAVIATMKIASLVLATLGLTTAAPALTTAAETREWSYRPSSSKFLSPAEWALEYPNCAGKRQSPVDIQVGTSSGKSVPLAFTGECSDFSVLRTAEAYRADVKNGVCCVIPCTLPSPTSNNQPTRFPSRTGSCVVTANAIAYPFAQFHIHAPSEHRIHGRALDGELHFVHKNTAGNIAVIGVFLEQKLYGKTDPFVYSVLDGLQHANTTNPAALKLYVLCAVYCG